MNTNVRGFNLTFMDMTIKQNRRTFRERKWKKMTKWDIIKENKYVSRNYTEPYNNTPQELTYIENELVLAYENVKVL